MGNDRRHSCHVCSERSKGELGWIVEVAPKSPGAMLEPSNPIVRKEERRQWLAWLLGAGIKCIGGRAKQIRSLHARCCPAYWKDRSRLHGSPPGSLLAP